MIKTIITMVVTAIAGLVGYLVSDSFRERLAQKQRDKIASEVARGDEAAVNARIGRFRSFAPWVFTALLIIGGCAVTRTVYDEKGDDDPRRKGAEAPDPSVDRRLVATGDLGRDLVALPLRLSFAVGG